MTVRDLENKRSKVSEELEKTLYGDNIGHSKQLEYNYDWSLVHRKAEKVSPGSQPVCRRLTAVPRTTPKRLANARNVY